MKRWRMMLQSLLLAAVAFGLGWCWGPQAEEPRSEDRPSPQHEHGGHADQSIYTCSMHPQVRQTEPGQCPICGMALVKVDDSGVVEGETSGAPRAEISLSPRARRLAGIETTTVQRVASARRWHLSGRLESDETRLREVTARIGGRIERLLVAATGARLKRGQAIARLYSPEVYAAQRDLRVAQRQAAAASDASDGARVAAESALQAARRRLELLGFSEREIDQMASADESATEVSVRSPVAGTVLQRFVTEGQYVKTGDPLFRVADLSRLWVQLDAHPSELAELDVGDEVQLRVPSLPSLHPVGRVGFLEPTVDPRTRVAQVRIEVDNQAGRLRPGMDIEATIEVEPRDASGAGLVVPASAVLFTGRRSLVYVEIEDPARPRFEPRTVELGAALEDAWIVSAGLDEGERVVVEGAFVLDADLQIRGGPSAMSRTAPAAPEWTQLVEAYLDLQTALAADQLEAARDAAQMLDEAAQALDGGIEIDAASKLRDATELETARSAFETLSARVIELVERRGNPLDVPLRVSHCPMVGLDRGASWLQMGESIDNPYFGSQMKTCGEFRTEIPPGEAP